MKKYFNFKKIARFILAISMILGIFTGCDNEKLPPNVYTTDKKYVSIGDSIASGFALPEYEKDGQKQKDTFAYLFSVQSNNVDYLDLATTGYDTEDVLSSISRYKDDGSIIGASVISLAIGSNDILRPGIELMCKAAQVESKEQLLSKFETLSKNSNMLGMLNLISAIWNSLSSEDAQALFKTQVENYKENIIKIIDGLLEASPNAKIYLINYYNPYAGLAFGSLDIGSIVDSYLNEMNQFVKEHQYSGKKYFIVDIANMDNNYTNVSLDTKNMALDPHPNKEGHKYIYEKLWDTYNQFNSVNAVLEYLDGSLEEEYFSSAAEAWTRANTILDKDIKITLLSDWISDVDYCMGTGVGFDNSGTIRPVDRKNKDCQIILDLNGHTIDRCLPSMIYGGEVFELRKDGTFTIMNGTITGGNNDSHGGAFWIDNDETTVILDNLLITNNKSKKNGAGIYIKNSSAKININDCVITENISSEGYGGGIYFSDGNAKVTIQGKMIVSGNSAKSLRENITIQRTGWFNTGTPTMWVKALDDGSEIYFNVSDNDVSSDVFYVDEKDLSEADAKTQYTNYFKEDNPKLKIKITTELDGSKKYKRYTLNIDK